MAKKRIFAIMLAMSMVLSLLPATAFAAEGETVPPTEQPPAVELPESAKPDTDCPTTPTQTPIEDKPDEELPPPQNPNITNINSAEKQGNQAIKDHDKATTDLNSRLESSLSEINDTLAAVKKSEALTIAESTYNTEKQNVDDAADALKDIKIEISEEETLSFDSLDDLLAYVNEPTKPGEFGTPDESGKPTEPEYSSNADIAAAEKAAYEAELEAWKAQQDAAKKAAEKAEADKKDIAAAKAQELVNTYNSALKALNSAAEALKTAAENDQKAIAEDISTAQKNYANLEKLAEEDPAQVSTQQLEKAKQDLELRKHTQDQLDTLRSQLDNYLNEVFTSVDNANNDRNDKKGIAEGTQAVINGINDKYKDDLAEAELDKQQQSATDAKQAVDDAKQFETDAKDLQDKLNAEPKPAVDSNKLAILKKEATNDLTSYIGEDGTFLNSSVDSDGGTSTGKTWLGTKIGYLGNSTLGVGYERGEILNKYLTLPQDEYESWYKYKFKKDPIILLKEKYVQGNAGEGLENLMTKLDAVTAEKGAYDSTLDSAKALLGEEANGKDTAQIIKTLEDNAQANKEAGEKLDAAIKAFTAKYKKYTEDDLTKEKIGGVVTAAGEAVNSSKEEYSKTIGELNDSWNLNLNADETTKEQINQAFVDLKKDQSTLNSSMEQLGTQINEFNEASKKYHEAYTSYQKQLNGYQSSYDQAKAASKAAEDALARLAEAEEKMKTANLGSLDDTNIQKLQKEVKDRLKELEIATAALEKDTAAAAKAKADADKAKDDAKQALEDAKKAADDAKKAADDAAKKAEEAQEALKNAVDDEARKQAEAEAERRRQEAEEAARLAEELRRALEAMRDYDDDDDDSVVIDEEDVPLAAGPTTRAQFVEYLWNHEGQPAAEAEDFLDVAAESDFAPAIRWARSIGIVFGDGNGNFMPDDLVTVYAVRSILARYAAYLNIDMPELTTLAGEDGNPVFNCADVLKEFFGE